MSRTFEICIDAGDPSRLIPFWSAALGYEGEGDPDGSVDLVDPAGTGPRVWFQQVTDPKVVKNRVHLDIWLAEPEAMDLVEELVGLGGTVIGRHRRHYVLGDPEGNELCVNWYAE